MLPVPVPKIYINDEEGSSHSLESSHHSIISKASSESLFKYDVMTTSTPSTSPKSDSFETIESQRSYIDDDEAHAADEDRHIPIPDCFSHSFSITAKDFSYLVKKKQIDVGYNRFGKIFHFIDKRTMIPLVGTTIKLETFSDAPLNNTASFKTSKVNVFVEDIRQLTSLKHRRICYLYGVYFDKVQLVVFEEFLPRGSVYDKTQKHPIEERIAIKYFRQACEGLKYIHSHNLSHGNIKASNLLITISDDIKIADFSMSHNLILNEIDEGNVLNYRIRLLHTAPEALKLLGSMTPTKIPPSADIWALGCTLVTMLTQSPPYSDTLKDKSIQEVYKIITDNCMKPAKSRLAFNSASLIPSASPLIQEVFDDVMDDDPFERPTAEEILNWVSIRKNKKECQKATLLSLEITTTTTPASTSMTVTEQKTAPITNNGHIPIITVDAEIEEPKTTTIPAREEETKALMVNNHHPHGKRRTTVIAVDMGDADDEGDEKKDISDEHPIRFFCCFVASRVIIFLMLMLKWTLMVFAAAFALSIVASSIFLSISIIYRIIRMSCQCELNEGFVVLIAIILLPILILLTTLCCNNACERYHQAVESDEFTKSNPFMLYISEPPSDVVVCGVKVIPRVGTRRKRSISAKRKADSDDDVTSPTNLTKGKVLNDIAILA